MITASITPKSLEKSSTIPSFFINDMDRGFISVHFDSDIVMLEMLNQLIAQIEASVYDKLIEDNEMNDPQLNEKTNK